MQLHSLLGIIPFTWFLLFLAILTVGTFKLGYIPKYGNRIDPGDLHIGFLTVTHAIFLILSVFAVIGWIALTIIIYSFYTRHLNFNKPSFRFFLIGMAGFIVFKYGFHSVFAWVLD